MKFFFYPKSLFLFAATLLLLVVAIIKTTGLEKKNQTEEQFVEKSQLSQRRSSKYLSTVSSLKKVQETEDEANHDDHLDLNEALSVFEDQARIKSDKLEGLDLDLDLLDELISNLNEFQNDASNR